MENSQQGERKQFYYSKRKRTSRDLRTEKLKGRKVSGCSPSAVMFGHFLGSRASAHGADALKGKHGKLMNAPPFLLFLSAHTSELMSYGVENPLGCFGLVWVSCWPGCVPCQDLAHCHPPCAGGRNVRGAALLGSGQNAALLSAPCQLAAQSTAGRAAGFTSVRPNTFSNTTPQGRGIASAPCFAELLARR